MLQLRLSKRYRLYLRGDIEALFQNGESLTVYPLRCTFMLAPKKAVMVSAPKKIFRHAVDRNLLKRRIRESYRLNQEMVAHLKLHISLNYVAREKLSYNKIEDATKEILTKLATRFAPCAQGSESDTCLSVDSSC